MVKLQTRVQDTFYTFKERIKILKQLQSKQRLYAKQRANSARMYAKQRAQSARKNMLKRSAKYKLLVKNIQQNWRVGNLSRGAISRGRRNLVSHYNAKKRVYARRKLTRQYIRTVNGSRTFIERFRSRYWGGRKALLGSLNINRNSTITITSKWHGITLTEPAQQNWFDNEGYPLTARDPDTGRFVNPWLSESSNGENGLVKFLRWKVGGAWSRMLNASASSDDNIEKKSIDQKTDNAMKEFLHQSASMPSAKSNNQTTQEEAISLTWIGHSTTLVTFPGDFTILTDPHFSNYAGPVRRMVPPSLRVSDLPDIIDCVLISHDHYDHLDYWSLLELIESNKVKYWVVPLGIKSWLITKTGISPEDIIELEWWEGVRLTKQSCSSFPEVDKLIQTFDKVTGQRESDHKTHAMPNKNELIITCAPAQHWCSRTPFDRNRRLWCSFAVHATPALSIPTSSRTHSFYFAGDTGLPPDFPLHHQIGDRLGPFDLCAIPIGAYEPEWFMRESHCNPSEAVQIHQALRSRKSVAVHFDTFDLADEARDEPPKLLLEEVQRVNENIASMTQEANDRDLIDMLHPAPLQIDFSVIKQGERIESSK